MVGLTAAEKVLLRYGLIVKCLILFLLLTLSMFPDHNADAFKPPVSVPQSTIDQLLRRLFSSYEKWDSLYFSFIARWGYLYEKTMAFFPLLPLFLGTLSRTLHFFCRPLLSLETLILVIGILFNNALCLFSAIQLYRLGLRVLDSPKVSFFASVLYCVTPASIFFSSLYSESLFFFLTLSGLNFYERRQLMYAALFFALSVSCRSNGLANIGYICYSLLSSDDLSHLLWSETTIFGVKRSWFLLLKRTFEWWFMLLSSFIPYIVACVICVLPFVIYQMYAFSLFCQNPPPGQHGWLPVPQPSPVLIDYGLDSGYRLPLRFYPNNSDFNHTHLAPPWCYSSLPLSYSYIQKSFWNVSLFGYYELKQIPNFLLAVPVVLLSFSCASAFYGRAPRTYKTLGLFSETPRDRRILPYILHMLFLCVYGITHINVQVITRIIFSSCPVIYWYCAYSLCDSPHWQLSAAIPAPRDRRTKQFAPSETRPWLTSWWTTFKSDLSRLSNLLNPAAFQTRKQRALVIYFISYAFVGCVLHCKFLPWT
ncbi:unnamed protein product [Calicophoron daubneyi]|uniref:GPI mannosyltransferase 2 n=1 Tax=Calicophoron daubneyi TaxID=300641 RepID=A0AAV2TVD9_CALDB